MASIIIRREQFCIFFQKLIERILHACSFVSGCIFSIKIGPKVIFAYITKIIPAITLVTNANVLCISTRFWIPLKLCSIASPDRDETTPPIKPTVIRIVFVSVKSKRLNKGIREHISTRPYMKSIATGACITNGCIVCIYVLYTCLCYNASMKKISKFNVVIFYGPFAVGKYTVAHEFHKQTNYKFFHNHHTYDIAKELFERGTVSIDRLCEKLRLDIFTEVATVGINTVSTHAYASNFVSKTGLSDPLYMKKIEKMITQKGGRALFVHLVATDKVLIERVVGNSRKKFNKLKDPIVMKKILKDKKDIWNISAPVKYNLQIDTTTMTPKQVVKVVRAYFSLL